MAALVVPPVMQPSAFALPGDRFVTADKPGQPILLGNAGSGQYGRMIFPMSTRRDADVYVQPLRRYDEAVEVPDRSERKIAQMRTQATTRQEPAVQFWESGMRFLAMRRDDRSSWQYTPFNAPIMANARGGQRQYTSQTQRANSVEITLPQVPSTQAYVNREQMRWNRPNTATFDMYDSPSSRITLDTRQRTDFGSVNFRLRLDVNDDSSWADANQLSRRAVDPRSYRTSQS